LQQTNREKSYQTSAPEKYCPSAIIPSRDACQSVYGHVPILATAPSA